MKKIVIRGSASKPKPRLGVHPTRIERDRTVYNRQCKHRSKQRGEAAAQQDGHTVRITGPQRMPIWLFSVQDCTDGRLP